MKIRNSFVANSSSSSFIIGCDKIPNSVEEAADIWFGDTKDFVAPIIIKGLFDEFKPIQIDFDKLKEKASSLKSLNWEDSKFDNSTEEIILREIKNNHYWDHKYGNDYSWSEKTKLQKKIDVAKERVIKKNKDKNFNEYSNEFWKAEERIEKKYFSDKKVIDDYICMVDNFIREFKHYNIIMAGEFADDSGKLGSELEHGDHWNKFKSVERYSHH